VRRRTGPLFWGVLSVFLLFGGLVLLLWFLLGVN
jgi:hypothetical protein